MAFPATYNFNYYRGDTFEMEINAKDANGADYLVANFTGRLNVAHKRGRAPEDVVAQISLTVSGSTINFVIPSDIGEGWSSESTYVYDVELVDGTTIYTVLTGTITVTDDVRGV